MVIGILGFVATVDSTHLKFVQQADLKTQIEDLEYRNDTKMDLTNHDTQKQVGFCLASSTTPPVNMNLEYQKWKFWISQLLSTIRSLFSVKMRSDNNKCVKFRHSSSLNIGERPLTFDSLRL